MQKTKLFETPPPPPNMDHIMTAIYAYKFPINNSYICFAFIG